MLRSLFVAKHGSVEYAALHDTMLEPATPVHNRVYCNGRRMMQLADVLYKSLLPALQMLHAAQWL